MAKKDELTEAQKRDKQRADDRAAELAKQKEVDDAMEAFYAEQAAAAAQALKDQQEYEVTGIRKVEGKP